MIVPFLLYKYFNVELHGLGLLLIAGLVVMGGGLVLLGYTVYLLATKGHGTIAPWDPPTNLVINGPYRFSRNPMISSVFFILIGEAFFFNQFYIMVWALIFFTINHLYFVFKEEPDMEKRFGDDYRNYKKQVPRWGIKISGLPGID